MEQVTINKVDNKGRGIGYTSGKIVFVKNALPGEIVTLKNIKEHKKYITADIQNIVKKSELRNIPKCPYYDSCGGCNLMHLGIDYQEEYKEKKVKEILKKYANIKENVKFIKNNKELYYRNKVTLKVKNSEFGYYNDETHNFIKVNNCLLVNNKINEFIKSNVIKINNGELVIRVNYQDELLINIRSAEDVSILNDINKYNVVGVVLNDKVIYGTSFFYDYIGDFRFKVSYNSFFQVNNYMASNIFMILKSNLKGKNLLDLYCGVGTLGLSLKDNFESIYGIEKIENAIIDAKENALINNCHNAHFYAGDTYEVLKDINVLFDTVIVDPPRSGLNEETRNLIIKLKPDKLCYVSCDPFTLARDLNILNEFYDVEKINALDMFPNTYHVECVCILERKELTNGSKIK